MNPDIVSFLLCPDCNCQNLSLETFTSSKDGQTIDGRLICAGCSNWFRVEHGIIDLLPMSLRETNPERFISKNETFAAKYRLKWMQYEGSARRVYSEKSKPIGAFEDVPDYEKTVVNNPYYKALDQIAFHDWMKRCLTGRDFVLDIGCGTGRQCVPLAKQGIRTIGIDVDEDMLILAKQKVDEPSLSGLVDLIIADGQNPPVKENQFSACVLYGVLHHLNDKALSIANATTKIAPGGLIYTLDPHKSFARGIFDFLMSIWKLYVEEASDDPLMTEEQLTTWMLQNNIRGKTKLSTFLPPHIFLARHSINVGLLKISDEIFSHIPWLRKAGGVLIFEGKKEPNTSS